MVSFILNSGRRPLVLSYELWDQCGGRRSSISQDAHLRPNAALHWADVEGMRLWRWDVRAFRRQWLVTLCLLPTEGDRLVFSSPHPRSAFSQGGVVNDPKWSVNSNYTNDICLFLKWPRASTSGHTLGQYLQLLWPKGLSKRHQPCLCWDDFCGSCSPYKEHSLMKEKFPYSRKPWQKFCAQSPSKWRAGMPYPMGRIQLPTRTTEEKTVRMRPGSLSYGMEEYNHTFNPFLRSLILWYLHVALGV